ncbi:MAG: hypothetical protein HKN07_11460 [Acidimicrobiia bacterium]|nr:hypothetical protein [Acidimicrobiia bacterium]NNF64857.1 hypothetical protein [Acidimicrobiia bacterium]
MKAPPIRVWPVIALFSLAASACGIAIPEDTRERQATPTSTTEAPAPGPEQPAETAPGADQPGPDEPGPDEAVDLDSLLTQLDDLVADLDTTLEGVSQP